MPTNGEPMRPLVVIVGPTAVGKTGVAVDIAEALNAEIISADSRQIYKYMHIATAKATPEQRARVPHHLVDFVEPDEPYNVTNFQHQAMALIEDMHERDVLPMLVGGTGQYVSATIEGWQFPDVAPNPELRAELETYADAYGWQALLERLRQHDPVTAARIDGKNIRRVVRALEVCLEAGRPYADFQQKFPPPYTVKSYCLTMTPRERLYARADKRIDDMLASGLVKEVEALAAAGYDWSLSSMHGLGYLQIGQYLQGKLTYGEAVHELKRATHLFIRRQYTWFRKYNAAAAWLENDEETVPTMSRDIQNWMQQR
jgi:tRNA dimethylallyltransferase